MAVEIPLANLMIMQHHVPRGGGSSARAGDACVCTSWNLLESQLTWQALSGSHQISN